MDFRASLRCRDRFYRHSLKGSYARPGNRRTSTSTASSTPTPSASSSSATAWRASWRSCHLRRYCWCDLDNVVIVVVDELIFFVVVIIIFLLLFITVTATTFAGHRAGLRAVPLVCYE